MIGIGLFHYDFLPQYMAVQVSEERWQISERIETDGDIFPMYRLIGKRLTLGQCNNELTRMQSQK